LKVKISDNETITKEMHIESMSPEYGCTNVKLREEPFPKEVSLGDCIVSCEKERHAIMVRHKGKECSCLEEDENGTILGSTDNIYTIG